MFNVLFTKTSFPRGLDLSMKESLYATFICYTLLLFILSLQEARILISIYAHAHPQIITHNSSSLTNLPSITDRSCQGGYLQKPVFCSRDGTAV